MANGAIARLHASLSWDLNDFDRGTAHIEGVFGKIRAMAVALGNSIRSAFKGMTVGITAPFIALSAYAVKGASDATELQGAFDQVFGNLSKGMNDWAEETGNAMGRSTQTMQESARQFQMLFKKAMDPAAAAEMSKTFTVLAEDVDSFYNLASGEGRAKLFSGLTGESEPLKALGVFINETAVKAKALELGLGGVKRELTDQEKIMARLALIREQLADADGDVIRTSDELANSWRALKETVQELRVEFGERLEPIAKRLVTWARNLLVRIQALPDWVKDLAVKFGILVAAIGPVMLVFSSLAILLLPLLLARMNGIFWIISAILNPIFTAAVTLWDMAGGLAGVARALGGLTGAGGFALLRTIFLRLTGPIGLAITAILFFKDSILSAFSKIGEYAQGRFGPALSRFFDVLGKLVATVSEKLDALAKSDVGQFFAKMIDWIEAVNEAWLVFLGKVLVEVMVGTLDILTKMTEDIIRFVDTVDGLLSGEWIRAWSIATDGTGNAVQAMINYLKMLFPWLYSAIQLIELISGKSLFPDNASPLGSAVGGAAGMFFDALDQAEDGKGSPKANASASGIPKTAGAGRKGRSGPSAAELEARQKELELQH
ncbi:MAG: phage tail tape measure protein, partial [Parasphingorhabdus sp.]